MSNDEKAIKEAIRRLIRDSLEVDQKLRDEYRIGDKFRFIRDRLQSLQTRIEEELQIHEAESIERKKELKEDETLVYVHLFNVQGLTFHSWYKLVEASVFYEYSVNRPIYTDKSQIEAFIRSRPNKVQHGYLTIAIKKDAILPIPSGFEPPRDQIGNLLVKIREGSLHFDRLLLFTHQEHEYEINRDGEMIKKT